MPAYLIFDLGENHIINQTRISYYNWNKGRIYQYSIFLANDTTHWQKIISNASSDSEEYTINNFEKINARFIKLLIIDQNQNEWATLWEAQMYGNDDTTNVSSRTENSKPLVNIPIRIDDGFGDSDTLFVGIDSSACDGLDLFLGETQFQTPLNGAFSAWLNMPNSQVASLKDYRYGCKLQNYEYTYQIQYQKGSANKVTINWNLPVAAKLKIQDVISGKMVDTVFNYGADSITINDPNDIYKLNFTVTYQSRIVPVEITSFNCELNKNNVELAWKTATELNNKGFEIERKLPDKSEWENVDFVRGNGTTVNPTLYKFIDDFKEQTVNGYVSYRLKQINLDGSSSYSNIIEFKVNLTPKDFALYQNYPNSFNPITDIKYAIPLASNVNIAIFNALGERIKEFNQGIKEAGTHDFIWHATDLASGVYFYTIIAKSADGKNNFRKTQKMMLLK